MFQLAAGSRRAGRPVAPGQLCRMSFPSGHVSEAPAFAYAEVRNTCGYRLRRGGTHLHDYRTTRSYRPKQIQRMTV